ncbi:MAG: hypothetical protein QM528_02900 [Phycisphaerales bacterium]|nr:hypothetical protein [Phycisphaerales bacterium]
MILLQSQLVDSSNIATSSNLLPYFLKNAIHEAYREFFNPSNNYPLLVYMGKFADAISLIFLAFSCVNIWRKKLADSQKDSIKWGEVFGVSDTLTIITTIVSALFFRDVFYWVEPFFIKWTDNATITSGDSMVNYIIKAFGRVSTLWTIYKFQEQIQESIQHLSVFGIPIGGLISGALKTGKVHIALISMYFVQFSMLFLNYLLGLMVYIERAVVLLMLNIFLPIVFAMSLLEKYKTKFWNYILLMIQVILAFPLLMMFFHFIDLIYIQLSDHLIYNFLHSNHKNDVNAVQELLNNSSLQENLSSKSTNATVETYKKLIEKDNESITNMLKKTPDLLLELSGLDILYSLPLLFLMVQIKYKLIGQVNNYLSKIFSEK